MDSSLDVKKILDIIDTYKYRSITGERVELVVSPLHDDGKYDLSKRKVTIGLQGGLNRDRESFIVNDITKVLSFQNIQSRTYDLLTFFV